MNARSCKHTASNFFAFKPLDRRVFLDQSSAVCLSVKAIFSARLKFGVYSEIRRLLSAGKEGGNSPLSSIKGAGTCHLVFKVGE